MKAKNMKRKKRVTKKRVAKKISGVKKHTDLKSHNVKINVLSGIKKPKLTAHEFRNLKALAKAHQSIWQGTNTEAHNLNQAFKIGQARVMLLEVIQANGFTIAESGRLIKLAN